MASIGIVVKPGLNSKLAFLENVLKWTKANNHNVSVDYVCAALLPSGDYQLQNHLELLKSSDVILSIGGDGTLIGLARKAQSSVPVLIGVHFGTLGFLTEIRPDELISVLDGVLSGRIEPKTRTVLEVKVFREKGDDCIFLALNDAVIQKGASARIVTLDVSIDGEQVTRIRGDGLIVATPTGSTAYSLSAGGPIVHASLPVLLLTPICAHSLTNRPLLIGDSSIIEVKANSYEGDVSLTVDGQESMVIKGNDRVSICKATHTVSFINSPSMSFYQILRTKLNWGLNPIFSDKA